MLTQTVRCCARWSTSSKGKGVGKGVMETRPRMTHGDQTSHDACKRVAARPHCRRSLPAAPYAPTRQAAAALEGWLRGAT